MLKNCKLSNARLLIEVGPRLTNLALKYFLYVIFLCLSFPKPPSPKQNLSGLHISSKLGSDMSPDVKLSCTESVILHDFICMIVPLGFLEALLKQHYITVRKSMMNYQCALTTVTYILSDLALANHSNGVIFY